MENEICWCSNQEKEQCRLHQFLEVRRRYERGEIVCLGLANQTDDNGLKTRTVGRWLRLLENGQTREGTITF